MGNHSNLRYAMKKITLEEVLDAAKNKINELLVPEDLTNHTYKVRDWEKYSKFYFSGGNELFDHDVIFAYGNGKEYGKDSPKYSFCGLKGQLQYGIYRIALLMDNENGPIKPQMLINVRGADADEFIKAAENIGCFAAENSKSTTYVYNKKLEAYEKYHLPRHLQPEFVINLGFKCTFYTDIIKRYYSQIHTYNIDKESTECKLISEYLKVRYSGTKGKLKKFFEC